MKQMVANAEVNIMHSQMLLENKKKYKEHIKNVMRQDENMIVFNSSAPRFSDEATH